MQNDNRLSLHADSLFQLFLAACKKYRYPLFSSLFFGFLSYMFLFTNKLPNHDDLGNLFDIGATIVSGRWGLALFGKLLPHYSLPWFHGVVTLFLIAAASCVLVSVFQIRSHLVQTLMAGAIIVFPSLLGTFGYMFTSVYYGIAVLLAALAVWFASRDRWADFVIALVFGVLTLGIYQAYLGLISSLLVTLLIQRALYSDLPPRRIFQKGMQFLLLLVLILLFYSGITFLSQSFAGIEMGEYAALALEDMPSLPERLRMCYHYFFKILLENYKHLLPSHWLRELNLLLLLVAAAELLVCGLRPSRRSYLPLLALLVVLYPISVNCMYLFVSKSSIHALVLYSFAMLYVLAAVILDGGMGVLSGRALLDRCRALCFDAALVAMALLVIGNCLRSNAGSLNLFLNYERNYALSTNLITQMQMTPGYRPDMPVALCGSLPVSHDPSLEPLDDVRSVTGMAGFSAKVYSYPEFWDHYLGCHVPFASKSDKRALKKTEEFQQMPTYPMEGCIQIIDDFLVVKLPEP